MELAQDDSFDYYSDDKVSFNIEYWKDLLTVYTEDDRRFLGQDTGLFLILRFVLQTLSQARLTRMSADSKLTIIENQVNRFYDTFLSKERIEAPINIQSIEGEALPDQDLRENHLINTQLERIIEKIDTANYLGQRGFNDLHSTLLSACKNDKGSGLDEEEEEEIIPENNKSNSSCTPCPQFSIRKEVAKHLR